jgi:transposase
METLTMSLVERDRLMLIKQVEDGSLKLTEVSARLGVSYRQVKRLWRRYRQVGDAGLVHGLRGRPSNNRPGADRRRERAVALYGERYRGFGPTFAAEQMAARDGLTVDHETLRGWLIAAGLWRPRRDKRRRHPRRPRRCCFGELVQLDGSDHDWLGTGERCCLMVMIDDATGRIEARFFEAETTVAAMTIFRRWALAHGLPRAVYPDRHSIHRRNDKAADEVEHRTGKRPLTRFGQAMAELGVELICARSPQAKGRVERVNGTLQDRLVKLLRLEGITTIDAANAYLQQTYLAEHNGRFAVEPAGADDAHRPIGCGGPTPQELDAALCPARQRRAVDPGGCVSWQGRCFELVGPDATPRRRRQVEVRQRLDGTVVLHDVTDGRVLQSREQEERPPRPEPQKPPPAERVAAHATPYKPPASHPWRTSPAVAGSVPGRGCAPPLHCAGHRDPPKGTLLLG